ncbi:uncharacterized protein BKCO1_120006 [Diplodia corticola]|uniref:Uncharacterized protein n=1 Tax=Diplodia corticola TaxID=236234 RepID=A0A1J9R7X3_9PEZI|nr:uncharacterized protein BKCO1_120006 [Diplodia corticola]OJD36298.1 hypothetical protein BKCO1_120006 [Diplodia corticola]
MFLNTHRLVHLPRIPPSQPESELPRGECRYRHREAGQADRQTCVCQGFSLNRQQPVGTTCECGHPAWVHVQQPMAAVTYDEHRALVGELARFKQEQDRKLQNLQTELAQTQHELMAQRAQNLERERLFKLLEARLYQNMKAMKIELDDKMDGVIDQQHAFQRKLIDVEDATMEHEIKIEKLESAPNAVVTRDLTPVPEASLNDDLSMDTAVDTAVEEPTAMPEKPEQPWSVKVMIVPRRSQQFAFEVDSTAHRRCQSRKLFQEIEFSSRDSANFHFTVDKAFSHVLKDRPWVPLIGYRAQNDCFGRIALRQIPPEFSSGDLWDYFFLDHHCVAHDKLQGDLLYIALRDSDLSWEEIKELPPMFGASESVWTHEVDLDGPLPGAKHSNAPLGRLDRADLMYGYSPSPPPYTSQRHHHQTTTVQSQSQPQPQPQPEPEAVLQQHDANSNNRMSTPLGVLATASASVLGHALSRHPTSQSATAQSLRSLGSTEDGASDDEHSHRDKIRKLRPKMSEPSMPSASLAGHGGGSGSSSHHHHHHHHHHHQQHQPQQPAVYYSGRSKRKMPVREKTKEPLQFKLPSLLHHRNHSNKEEAA